MPDEREIIARVRTGEVEAYAELVRAHQAAILRLCASLLSHAADAEDAAQEIFLKAYDALGSFRQDAAFSTWLYRIATNHCRDLLRQRARQRAESLDALLEAAGDAAEMLFAPAQDPRSAMQTRDLIEQVLRRLSPDERLLLTLREAQGLSYQELAAVLDCSLDAVKARLHRAREALLQIGDTFRQPPASKPIRRPA